MNDNTSGHGEFARLPYQLDHWNWGAFLLPIPWGLVHGVYIALLCLVPVVGLFIPFYLGAKGNQKAWQSKYWESEDKFASHQRKWAIAGVVVTILSLLLYFVPQYIESQAQEETERVYEQMQTLILANEEVKEILGKDIHFLYTSDMSSLLKGDSVNQRPINVTVLSEDEEVHVIVCDFTIDDIGGLQLNHVEVR